MRRRSLLAGSAAALGITACNSDHAMRVASAAIPAAVSGPLGAIIEYKGETYRYDETTGTDLGDYIDPRNRFVQGCIRSNHDRLPLTVLFRRDKTSDRAEVVFELGRIFTQAPPANLDAYRVSIVRGDKTVFSAAIPGHFWSARWRWQSAPRPVTAKIPDLIAAGLLPHYDEAVTGGFTPASAPSNYAPMGLAGVYPSMPDGGERPDIGPLTECQADYICTGRASALSTLLAQAEASGTIPWHLRDERTGAPLDTVAYPKATMYEPNGASPFIPRAPNTPINPDPAHEPALAYVPFLLTGDPYYLEELQTAVNFNIIRQPPAARVWYNLDGAVRAHAWSLRSTAQAATVTPDTVPSWLLPRSYFKKILDGNRDWMLATYVKNAGQPWATFRTIEQTFGDHDENNMPSGTYLQPWMEEFEAFILGWVVMMGHADWRPILEWKIKNTIARTNGTSGWVRAWCTTYRLVLRTTRADPWAADWAAAWALNVQKQPVLKYTDPNALVIGSNDISYPGYTLAALAMAARLGIAEAVQPHAWIAGEIRKSLNSQRRMARRWCVS